MYKNDISVVGERPLQLRAFKNPVSGNYYLLVRELAVYIGAKQPFEFTSEIKAWRKNSVLSGGYTETFRPKEGRKKEHPLH